MVRFLFLLFLAFTLSSGNNNLYAHLGGLNLVALNSLTGEMLWEKNFNVPIISGPTSNSKGVFITLIDGTLKFLYEENGELIWERKVISNIDDVSAFMTGGSFSSIIVIVTHVQVSTGS